MIEEKKFEPAVLLAKRGKGVPRKFSKAELQRRRLRMLAMNKARAKGNSADRRKAKRAAARKLKEAA